MKDGEPSVPTGDGVAPAVGMEQRAAATERFFRDAVGMPSEDFLLNISGQRAYGPHASAARLQAADLAEMADIDYMMSHARFRGTDVQPIWNGGARPDRHTTAESGPNTDYVYVYGQFAKGVGLRLLRVERYLPRVAGFAAELGAVLAENVSANIYLTPANGEGLDRHYDSHDVFVLQCVGSKRWRLYADDYASARQRPTGSAYAFDSKKHPPGRVDRDVEMTPGDLLYLPRGTMHEVAPPSGDSLHITFAVHTLTVAELAHRALRLAAKEVEGLRSPVSHALRLQATVEEQFAAELAAELAGSLSRRHLEAALVNYRNESVRNARLAPAGHLFGSHRGGADDLARLGAALAERVRSHELKGRADPIQPKYKPRASKGGRAAH